MKLRSLMVHYYALKYSSNQSINLDLEPRLLGLFSIKSRSVVAILQVNRSFKVLWNELQCYM